MEAQAFDMQPAIAAMLQGAASSIGLLPWWIILVIPLLVVALIALKLRTAVSRPRGRRFSIAARSLR